MRLTISGRVLGVIGLVILCAAAGAAGGTVAATIRLDQQQHQPRLGICASDSFSPQGPTIASATDSGGVISCQVGRFVSVEPIPVAHP